MMIKLSKTGEQTMALMWRRGPVSMKGLVEALPDLAPSTIATFLNKSPRWQPA